MRIRVIPPKNAGKVKKLRVCAYARVSSDSEEQEDSLVNQTAYYQEYISENPTWEFAGIYSDQGISGYNPSRPGFQQMLEDARSGKLDLILVKSVSRFARNTVTLLEATRELKSLGVGVYFEIQGINTMSTVGELMLTIEGAFAQAESESNSTLARMSWKRKFANLERTAASERTFGFYADEDGNLRVNPEEAEVVSMIFDLCVKGVWPSKIKEYLNKRGIPAPLGGKWDDSGIARVLRNEMYKGDLILQKTVKDANRVSHRNNGEEEQWYIENNHTYIVPPEEWDKAQEVLAERRFKLDHPPEKPEEHRSSHNTYPLSGKLYCPYCGQRMIHNWGSQRREYWACRTNLKVSAAACKGVWLPAAETTGWDIDEPVTVIPYDDEYGMRRFTAFPKDEYDAFLKAPDGEEGENYAENSDSACNE